nr:MAG TPA: ASCH domain protein [Caudoviricetes sp.]DAJ14583.1 MAG TPA: ASCH domain protein [Siphoviridae sp. ctdzB12]
MNLVYGAIKQGSKTVRLQMHYKKPFDLIRIGNVLYRVDFERKLRTKHVFVVSEVQ